MQNKKVLIVKNITREGPGLIEIVLSENKIPYHFVDLSKGKNFPKPTDYSGVFVLGGPDSANDETPKMKNELEMVDDAIYGQIPYFGVCLGMQVLGKAIGGEVYKHDDIKEIGFRDPKGDYFKINLTIEGKNDPIFEGLKSPLPIFQLHGESVHLGPETTLLASGKYCKVQVIKVGDLAYGFQGHLELTESMLEKWIKEDSDLKFINPISLRLYYDTIKSEYENNGRMILNNFLRVAKLRV